jgi:hypothetical protein
MYLQTLERKCQWPYRSSHIAVILRYEKGADKLLGVERTFVNACVTLLTLLTLLTHSIANKCYTFGNKTTVFLLSKKITSRHFVESNEAHEQI